jgi:threonine/homoserine/homoserine lactone efflux protein
VTPAPEKAPRRSYRKVAMLGLSSAAVVAIVALVPGADRAQVSTEALDVLSNAIAFVVGVNAAEYLRSEPKP